MISSKLITCILDKSSVSFDIVRELKEEHQITRANVGSARGTGTGAKGGLITMPQEKHILQVLWMQNKQIQFLVGYMIVLNLMLATAHLCFKKN